MISAFDHRSQYLDRGSGENARPNLRVIAVSLALFAGLLAWSIGPAEGYVYKTARGLYRDCAAGTATHTETARQRYRRCADFIDQIFNNWNLNQDNGICSRYDDGELPKAYVEYWRRRRQGLLPGLFTSAESSVNEFLDSEKQACPVPDPKTHPP
jgi:hypothetical protein